MPQANDLRSALETIYLAARASVDEPTPDAFLRIAEVPSFTPEKETKLRETWNDEMSKNALKNFVFEDPSKHEFVKVVERGEWAGYYYLSDLTEADRLTVNLMRFHQVGGTWKVYMQQSVASEPFEAESGKTRAQAIEGIIAESDSLQKIVPEAN